MAEELIDVFNPNNQPTGEVLPRTKVHTRKLWHRVAHAHVFRGMADNLEFVVHKRSSGKDSKPGRWDARFGGHIKSGQTPDQAILEELYGEAGIETDISSLLRGEVAVSGGHRAFIYVYYYPFTGNISDLRFNDGEVVEAKWMRAEEILAEMKNDPENWTSWFGHINGVISFLQSKLKDDQVLER